MASSIPGALAGLVTLWTAALDVDVHDGAPLEEGTDDFVCVGDDGSDSGESVAFDRSWAGIGAQRLEEDFDVLCSLVVWSGDEETTAACRARAFELLDACTAALAEDPTLGGAVRLGQVLGSGVLTQQQTEDGGAGVGLRFRVTCQARINGTNS